jgi:hypothetical protein
MQGAQALPLEDCRIRKSSPPGAAIVRRGILPSPAQTSPKWEKKASEPETRGSAAAATGGAELPSRVGTGSGWSKAPARKGRPKEDFDALGAGGNATFDAEETRSLRKSAKVLVVEYSSTGGGHTDRCLLPVKEAVANGTLANGDSVVLLAPPRWQHDVHGGHVTKLHARAMEMRLLGLNVILKQADKTVTGLYKEGGASDNVAMLRDFVYKPWRGPEVDLSTQLPDDDNPRPRGRGQRAAEILDDLIQAVGVEHMDKIATLGDMAPYLQRAAKERGITTRVEIGNHQGLFTGAGRAALEGKDLSYLARASSSGQFSQLSLVDYNQTMNVVPSLPSTLQALGIEAGTSKQAARERVLEHLFANAKKTSLDAGARWTPGILVHPNATPQSIKAMVYLYVNDYTQGVAEHLRDRIRNEPETFGATLFALCGPRAFNGGEGVPQADNILHVMYAANADGATSAGFGTTSEFHYLHHNGYAGKFIVAPVENQHEQGANAEQLADLCAPGVVARADGMEQLNEQLDTLVASRFSQPSAGASVRELIASLAFSKHEAGELHGDMASILNAANRRAGPGEPAVSNDDHAARLLGDSDTAMSASAHESIAAMANYDAAEAPKERRRVYKLLVPALDSLIEDAKAAPPGIKKAPTPDGGFSVLATQRGGEPRPLNVRKAIALMREAAQISPAGDAALQDLLHIEIKNVNVKKLLSSYANELESLMEIKNVHKRSQAAERVLSQLAHEEVALGW